MSAMNYTTTSSEYQHLGTVVMRKKKMKKPDRFERTVKKWFARIPQGKLVAIEPEVAKLLRQEHAWFRRIVNREYDRMTTRNMSHAYTLKMNVLCELDQRRK